MSNTFYFKFSNHEMEYKGRFPCTRHFNSDEFWKFNQGRLVHSDQPFTNDFYPSSSSLSEGKASLLRSNIEWAEYRLHGCSLTKIYSKILMESSIGKYLTLVDGLPVYRFTMNEPYRRFMLIIQVMRYLEEHQTNCFRFFRDNTYRKLEPDQVLAALSVWITLTGNSNHAAFYPPFCLKGLFSYLPALMSDMLADEGVPLKESSDWLDTNNTALILDKYNFSGISVNRKGYYSATTGINSTINGIVDYFNEEVK